MFYEESDESDTSGDESVIPQKTKRKRARRSTVQRPTTEKVRIAKDPNVEAKFKEKVNDAVQRLTSVSFKYCTSGKFDQAPVVAISIKKVSNGSVTLFCQSS